LSFGAAIIYIHMGVYAWKMGTWLKVNRVFFFFCLALAWWSFAITFSNAAPNAQAAEYWHKLSSPGWAFASALVLHFALALTGEDGLLKKWWIYAVIYLPGTVFTIKSMNSLLVTGGFVLTAYGWGTVEAVGSAGSPWNDVFSLYYVGYLVLSIVLIIRWGRRSRLKREKKQDRIITASLIIGMIVIFLDQSLLSLLGISSVPRVPELIGLLWTPGMWYAIVKYRKMNIAPRIATDQIIGSIMDMLVLVDPQGRIVRVNRRLEELLGYREEELHDRPSGLLFAAEDHVPEKLGAMNEGPASRYSFDTHCRTSDGGAVPVAISATLVRDREGDSIGTVVVAHDLRQTRDLEEEIALRRKMEDELRQSNEKLTELDKLKTDFLSTVSHELRTPLTSILGFAKIIRKRLDDVVWPAIKDGDKKVDRAVGQIDQNMDIIVAEGERLTELISNVLDIAKMESGRIEWQKEPVFLGEVVQRAVAATASLFNQRGLKLALDLDIEDKLPGMVGDRDRLVQVVINLLSNAVKFTANGQIICRARLTDTGITVSVIDTGIGIAAGDQGKIFEQFKQLGDTLTEKPVGTGLGLPICKHIVKHHGGRIWVESKPGEGSTFLFTLPVMGRSEPPGQAGSSAVDNGRASGAPANSKP